MSTLLYVRPGTTSEIVRTTSSGQAFGPTLPPKKGGSLKLMHISPHLRLQIDILNKRKSPLKIKVQGKDAQYSHIDQILKEAQQEQKEQIRLASQESKTKKKRKLSSDDEEEQFQRYEKVSKVEDHTIQNKDNPRLEKISSLPNIQIDTQNHQNSNTISCLGNSVPVKPPIFKGVPLRNDSAQTIEELGESQSIFAHNQMPSSFSNFYNKRMKNKRVLRTPSNPFVNCEGCGQDLSEPCFCLTSRKPARLHSQGDYETSNSQSSSQNQQVTLPSKQSIDHQNQKKDSNLFNQILDSDQDMKASSLSSNYNQIWKNSERTVSSEDIQVRAQTQGDDTTTGRVGNMTLSSFHRKSMSQREQGKGRAQQSQGQDKFIMKKRRREGSQLNNQNSQSNISELVTSGNFSTLTPNQILNQQSMSNNNASKYPLGRNFYPTTGLKTSPVKELEKTYCKTQRNYNSNASVNGNNTQYENESSNSALVYNQIQNLISQSDSIRNSNLYKKNAIQERIQNTKKLHLYFYSCPKAQEIAKYKKLYNHSPQKNNQTPLMPNGMYSSQQNYFRNNSNNFSSNKNKSQGDFRVPIGDQNNQNYNNNNSNNNQNYDSNINKNNNNNIRNKIISPLGVLQSQSQRDFYQRNDNGMTNAGQSYIKLEDISKQQHERLDLVMVNQSNDFESKLILLEDTSPNIVNDYQLQMNTRYNHPDQSYHNKIEAKINQSIPEKISSNRSHYQSQDKK